MDYTPEDVGSKPTTGIVQFVSFREADRHSSRDVKHEHKHKPFTDVAQRYARGAHNSEVTGSTPVVGISNSRALQKYAVKPDVKQARVVGTCSILV